MADGKRYARRRAQLLLARVMAVLSIRDAPIAKARRMYLDLLQARFSDIVIAESVRDTVRTAPNEDIALWHKNLRSLLGLTAMLRHASGTGTLPEVKFSGVTVTILKGADVRLEVVGIPKQMLLLQLLTLVRTVGHERLQRCDCGRLFARVGKRRFCSEPCQKRVYMRRYRAGDVGRE